jgi:hypothetical protein
MVRFSTPALCIIGCAAFIVGCNSGTDTGGTSYGNLAVTRPGVGSVFLLHDYALDSSDRPPDVYDEWDTAVVASSGISYQGKTNVVVYKTTTYRNNSTSESLCYYNYESNGDISRYVDGGSPSNPSGWETIPLASKGYTSFVVHDSTFLDSSGTSREQILTDEYLYTTQYVDTVAGAIFHAISLTYEQIPNGQKPWPYVGTDDWVPAIGFIVQSDRIASKPEADGAMIFIDELVSYTLK